MKDKKTNSKELYINGKPYPNAQSNDPEERRLAQWISKIRKQYKEGTLPKKQIELIESEIPGFQW